MSAMNGASDLGLLEIDLATTFVLCGGGRFERENDPDRSVGPRVAFLGCPEGNVYAVRRDVPDRLAGDILALASEEPPWGEQAHPPACLAALIDLLGAEEASPGLIYFLPHAVRFAHAARIVGGGTTDGDLLAVDVERRGWSPSLRDMGFTGVGDLWPPWCATLDGEVIASLAFAARLGDAGAEIGVATAPEFRHRGFAAAATAAWSSLPTLENLALFYSTQKANISSQRVAARLGLRRIGASLRIG